MFNCWLKHIFLTVVILAAGSVYAADLKDTTVTGDLTVTGTISGDGSLLTNLPGTVSALTIGYIPTASSATTLVDSGIYQGLTGNIGIGSSAPQSKLDVEGGVYFGVGNVGIGTATPQVKFEVGTATAMVAGSAPVVAVDGNLYVDGTVYGTVFYGSAANLTNIPGAISGLVDNYLTRANGTTAIESSIVYDTGTNIGIGSTIPQAKLDVEGGVYFGVGNVGIGTATPQVKMEIGTGTHMVAGSTPVVAVDGNVYVDGTVYGTYFYGNGSQLTGVSSISGLNAGYISKASSATAIVDSGIYEYTGGNIGIGSAIPQAKLDVEGTVYVGIGNVGIGTPNPTASLQIVVNDLLDTDYPGLSLTNNTAATAADPVQYAPALHLRGSGWAEIGARTRTVDWEIINVPATGQLASSTLLFRHSYASAAYTTPFTISSGGNVGVNSTAPQAKLDVEGTVYIGNGNVGLGTALPQATLEVGTATAMIAGSAPVVAVDGNLYVDGVVYGTYIHGNGSLLTNLPAGVSVADATGTTGLTVVVGTAATAMRSDASPALSVAIAPTWTGIHTFSNATNSALFTGGNVGIGSAIPQAKLDVEGGVYFGVGNVGIGTATPQVKFEVGTATAMVAGSAPVMAVDGNVYVDGTVYGTTFYGSAANLTNIPGAISGLADNYLTRANGATAIESSIVYDTGTNIGIGSTIPQAKLDVEGGVYFGVGNVGIGTATPQVKFEVGTATQMVAGSAPVVAVDGNLYVDGTVYGTYFYGNGSQLTGVSSISGLNAGYISKASSATGIVDSGIYEYTGGNIGIGSTIPQAKLDVEGNVYIGNGNVGLGTADPTGILHIHKNSLGTTYYDGLKLANNTPSLANGEQYSPALYFKGTYYTNAGGNKSVSSEWEVLSTPISDASDYGQLSFRHSEAGAAYTTPVIMDSNGYVTAASGFWTYSGSDYGVETYYNGTAYIYNVTTSPFLEMYSAVNGYRIAVHHEDEDQLKIVSGGDYSVNHFVMDGDGNIGLNTGTPLVKLDVDGDIYARDNVGIGTAYPQATLEVGDATAMIAGSSPIVAVDGNVYVDGTVYGTYFYGNGSLLTGVSSISGLTDNYIPRAKGTTEIENSIIFDSGTNIGIGSALPQAKLDVEGTVYFGNGNVGIGSASPVDKLEVDGTVYAHVAVSVGTATPAGAGAGQITLQQCLMIRDSDNAGWTECYALNGILNCRTNTTGVCGSP